MHKGLRIGVVTVVGGLVLGAGWWLGSPLFLHRMVDEPMPMAKETMGEAPMKPDSMMEKALYKGMLSDGDALHHAAGMASILEVDGGLFLRLEEFMVTNGPDLHVVLVKPGTPAKDGIILGALKGNSGSQNYPVPAGTDLMSHSQVVIWCKTFNVTFGSANLMPAM